MNRIPVVLSSLALAISLPVLAHADGKASFSPFVDAKGRISLPADFRNKLSHLGSWYVPGGPASGFHDVYADAAGVSAYRNTGAFADGTVLVKQLRANHGGDYTTGTGVQYATGIKQTFVMIKDSRGRFKGNKNWGDGWGWALFKADDESTNVSTDYKVDCIGCHTPAKKNDWVYIEGYPTLAK